MEKADIDIYSKGIVSLSVCVPMDMKPEEIEEAVNAESPTGISSMWEIGEERKFSDGSKMPCDCDYNEDRLHYLLHC